MDLIRSCYSQKVRYRSDDPTLETVCRWSFCVPGADAFPEPHAFGSDIWDSVHPTPTILGFDAEDKRKYYNGRPVNFTDGKSFAGPIDWFVDGQPDATVLPRGCGATPVECLRPPYGLAKSGLRVTAYPAIGGVYKGGTRKTPAVACSSCPTTTPATLVVTLAGATGPQSVWNGTNTLDQQASPCFWRLELAPFNFIGGSRVFPNIWLIVFSVPAGNSATYQGPTADCAAAQVLPLTGQVGGGTWPPTITMNPV
jgi:hypothetical protein